MNVKPSDLAIVVDCDVWGFNGATCIVLQLAAGVQCQCKRPVWFVKFGRSMPWTQQHPIDRAGQIGMMPDCQLRKIGGPDIGLQLLRTEPQGVLA